MAADPKARLIDTGLVDDIAQTQLQRAQSELRQGRLVAWLPNSQSGSLWVIVSVETLVDARLEALRRCGLPLRVLLSQERAQSLGLPQAHGAQWLRVPADVSLSTLHALAGLHTEAALVPPHLNRPLEPAPLFLYAAVDLAKRARLAPALLMLEWPAERWNELSSVQILSVCADDITQGLDAPPPALQRVSTAQVPIAAHGDCTLVLFREINGDAEHLAIIVGHPDFSKPMPVRLHSSCLTGDLLGSLRCDCGDQLQRAIEHLAMSGGVLLYMAQEGRATGLASKLRAYRLQDQGLDTIDADRYLGFRGDERDFSAAAAMLRSLGVAQVQLLTNNPNKIDALKAAGIKVVKRVPLIATVNAHNARYIETKHQRAGHLRATDEQDGVV